MKMAQIVLRISQRLSTSQSLAFKIVLVFAGDNVILYCGNYFSKHYASTLLFKNMTIHLVCVLTTPFFSYKMTGDDAFSPHSWKVDCVGMIMVPS